ncbi:MAG: BREX system P-loop protein BrxC, partial [Planctomycetota bacterium]
KQADAVRDERRLLDPSDPVPAIHKEIATLLRAAVNKVYDEYTSIYNREKATLEANDNWNRLKPAQQQQILISEEIDSLPALDVSDDAALLCSLEGCPLSSWKTRTNALTQQFVNAALTAAKLLEPTTQHIHLTSSTLKTTEEVKSWIKTTEQELLTKVKTGPVVIN